MRIEPEIKLDYKDVLLLPKPSSLNSRKEVDLEREFKFPHSDTTWKGVPIVAANMDTTGTFETAKVLSEYKMLTCIHKHYAINDWVTNLMGVSDDFYNHIAVSVGVHDKDLDTLDRVMNIFPLIKFICIDAANGYTKRFCEFIKKARSRHQDKIIIAGNVVTGEMAREIILSGADITKAGVGSGASCLTRIQTGVGYSQFSANFGCADAVHGENGHLMADGGCTNPGDIAKAFGSNSDFVMVGGMFSGHDESGGEVITKRLLTNELDEDNSQIIKEEKYKEFYGMSSKTAMNKHHGGVANYRSSEGKRVEVKYRGPIKHTIESILGGIRSTCTYIGAKSIKNMPKCATFIKVTQQSNEVFGRNT